MGTRLKFVSIVGARPQFVKAAVMSRSIRRRHDEILVHTGQHYDPEMSAVFFDELEIPRPAIHLTCGPGTHGQQTSVMLVGLEQILMVERPDWVVVFGDTNSTLAGALAAAKLGLSVAHVEAGLRSFKRDMAEEINRTVTDRLSTALLCPSSTAVQNLASEGIRHGVHLVGDVMFEVFTTAAARARTCSRVLNDLGVSEREYVLVTLHRAENTDDHSRLRGVLRALDALDERVIFPVHPRTRKAIDALGYEPAGHVRLVAPLGYLDMVRLLVGARLLMTDSGGLQKEAYWAGISCLTLRDETEWVETVELGWNRLVGTDERQIIEAARTVASPGEHPDLYGTAGVADRCVDILTAMAQRPDRVEYHVLGPR
jgi:UDP-N-acetylglucosamine 2-epimerase